MARRAAPIHIRVNGPGGWYKRLPNIAVYYVSAIVDGDVKAAPLGMIPRFSEDYENSIKAKHHPNGATYVGDTLNGTTVILFWNIDRVDAVSFLSADDARAFPGFSQFSDEDLPKLGRVLFHFPGEAPGGDPQ